MSTLTALKYLTVPALTKHTATVIFVHGLGDTGYGWQPFAEDASLDKSLQHVKWILPHAPIGPVTANMGMSMPTWFDILSFGGSFNSHEDEKGMLTTVKRLEGLIEAEVNAGIDPSRIVLGGFSQGAAMTLLTGLTTQTKLGGLVVLSGWLPLKNRIKEMLSAHASSVPIFWGHGEDDPLVKFQYGKDSRDYLTSQLGIPLATSKMDAKGLNFNSYRGLVHSASAEELNDVMKWLKQVIPAVYVCTCAASVVLFWNLFEKSVNSGQ